MTNVIIITLTIVNELKQNDMNYEILDYEIETTPVTRILLQMGDDRTIIADFGTLSELNENAGMYLNDPFYYKGELRDLCEQFIEEVNEYEYL